MAVYENNFRNIVFTIGSSRGKKCGVILFGLRNQWWIIGFGKQYLVNKILLFISLNSFELKFQLLTRIKLIYLVNHKTRNTNNKIGNAFYWRKFSSDLKF